MPVLVLESELCAAEVLGGEGGPNSELYAAEEKAQVSCCWSGFMGLQAYLERQIIIGC